MLGWEVGSEIWEVLMAVPELLTALIKLLSSDPFSTLSEGCSCLSSHFFLLFGEAPGKADRCGSS